MDATAGRTATVKSLHGWTAGLRAWADGQRWLDVAPLLGVVALALVLNTWGLSKTGFGNTYYAAAARSMSESWHNFVFGSFDPGGFITVDKPPVFLWFGALASRVFGFSSWSVLAPSAVAGGASVALLWLVLRRFAGPVVATVAAVALALTPIAVTVNRMNLPEPFYVLALVAAAAAVMLSLDSKRWLLWTVVAGVLVGVAFSTKMLAAWVPGPALALAIVAGARGAWWLAWREWLPRLAVLALATFAASAAWMLAVDAWPDDDRPYIGGSADNSVSNLVLVYNGLDRVEGFEAGSTSTRGRGFTGPLRMFDAANGGQIGWLLPLAAIGGLACVWRWRDERLLRALSLLWLGWVLLFATVFSYAEGIYHPYYTAALAPGIAALAGLSAVALVDLARRHIAWVIATAGILFVTLGAQVIVGGRPDAFYEPLRYLSIAVVVAGIALLLAGRWRGRVSPVWGLGVAVAGLLMLPGAWSFHEMTHAASNEISPRAGPRPATVAAPPVESPTLEDDIATLAAWLAANAPESATWAMAVSNSREAAPYIIEHGLSVAPLGGFSGRDAAISEARLRGLVDAGQVQFMLLSIPEQGTARTVTTPANVTRPRTSRGFTRGSVPVSGSSRPAGAKVLFDYAQANCEPVTDPAVPLRFRSELKPDEGGSRLYDCSAR